MLLLLEVYFLIFFSRLEFFIDMASALVMPMLLTSIQLICKVKKWNKFSFLLIDSLKKAISFDFERERLKLSLEQNFKQN